MKFALGNSTDVGLVDAMTDEASNCIDAFLRFEKAWQRCIMGAPLNKQAHDGYFRFLQHLYEWYKAAFNRVRQDTQWARVHAENERKKSGSKRPWECDVWDSAFSVEAHRLVNRRILNIQQKCAPDWENDIRYYQGLLSMFESKNSAGKVAFDTSFGTAFRRVRNNLHVSHERAEMRLIGFYRIYHGLIWLLFDDLRTWRGKNVSSIGRDFSL